MQQQYELMLVIPTSQSVEEKAVKDMIKKYSSGDAKVTEVKDMGKRKLAYMIKKQTEANYSVISFTAETSVIPGMMKKLQVDEMLLRYLIINKGK